VRFAWVFPATYLPRYFSAKIRTRDPSPSWRAVVIIAWAGMRGVVSLAAALSLPLLTDQNGLFPQRDLVIFLTFSVILVTLVLQGLSLPLLIKWLNIPNDSGAEKESNIARLAAAQAGRRHLEELAASENVPDELLNRVRNMYDTRIQRYTLLKQGEFDEDQQASFNQYQQWQKALMLAEFEAVIKLRDEGIINDVTLREIQHDLDLHQLQMNNLMNRTESLNAANFE
jgi:monovalent cation/hydrogen antiporter